MSNHSGLEFVTHVKMEENNNFQQFNYLRYKCIKIFGHGRALLENELITSNISPKYLRTKRNIITALVGEIGSTSSVRLNPETFTVIHSND